MHEPSLRPWPWLWLALLVHSVSFVSLVPRAWLVHDETFYVRQASAFAAGHTTVETWDGERQAFVPAVPSPYPPGTSLLMAAPVRAFGPRGALLVPWLASLVLVLATAAWLAFERVSPLFALLTLTYPPTLVASRLAMSDVPSAALVASSLALFGLGTRRASRLAMLGAGALAGASLCLRETNPLMLAPLFAGVLLRRERAAGWLFAGSALGVGLRLLLADWLFGDALFMKPLSQGFSLPDLLRHLPLYLIATLVFVPGGLVWVARYRGERRIEIVSTVVIFVALYASYEFAGEPSGFMKSLILGPRYLIPLTPVLALCAGSAFAASARGRALPRLLVIAACVMPIACALGMHAYEQRQIALQRALSAHVHAGDVVITDALASAKLLLSLGEVKTIELDAIDDVGALLTRGERVWMVVVDREDSALWRELRDAHAAYLRELASRVQLAPVVDIVSVDTHLGVWRVLPRAER